MLSISLNKEQKQAVIHFGSPLLVAAGPGSGKTTVIVERIKHLLQNGMRPQEILCLTFTERAANVMKERLESITDVSEMQISTYHSFCHDVLRDNVLDSGIGMSSGVITRASLLVWALENYDSFGFEHIEHGNNPVEIIESMIDGISTFKDELISPEMLREYLDSKLKKKKTLVSDIEEVDFLHKLEDLHKLYVRHQEYLRAEQLIDYDDMIVETVKIFQKKPHVLQKYQKQFKYVLVDEFQDNNYVQLELVKLLTPEGNVTVVGDDDQSIMKFQGAYARIFDDFLDWYKKAKVIKLVQNFRSPKYIVNFSSDLLKGKPDRIEKDLYSEKEGSKTLVVRCGDDASQVEFVIKKIQEILADKKYSDSLGRPVSFGDFTILSRNRSNGRKFAQGLNSHGIPATFVGDANLFSTSIGRDAMAFLEIVSNPTEAGPAITRILQKSGIPEQDIAKINYEAEQRAWKSETTSDFVFEVLEDLKVEELDQVDKIKDVTNLLKRCIELRAEPVTKAVFEILMRESGLYKSVIRTDTLEDKKKQTILKKIYEIAQQFEIQKRNGTLPDFLEYVRSLGKFDVELEEGTDLADSVVVSTIHQSKGNEFPFVFVVDVAARSIPASYDKKTFFVPDDIAKGVKNVKDGKEMHLEEERRILYVAMTRAQHSLFVTYPKTYSTGKARGASKFLIDDLDFENNENCEIIDYNGRSANTAIPDRNKNDVLVEQTQAQITSLVNQMQLKNAISKIIDLAKIEHFKKMGSMKGFDPSALLSIKQNGDLEKQLHGEKIQLVNKDELRLSATAFDNYLKCPLQFKYSFILNVPQPSSTVMDLGSVVHKVFELLSKRLKEGEKVDQKTAFELLEKNWDSRSYKQKQHEVEDKKRAQEMIKEFLAWIGSSPNKVKDVEKKFNMKIGDVIVVGKIDLVMETPQGNYQVFDFKTGKSTKTQKEAVEDTQMNLYPLAVKELYGKFPEKSTLYYIAKNLLVENKIEEANVLAVKTKLEHAAESIIQENFEPEHERGACRFCSFRSICDHAEV